MTRKNIFELLHEKYNVNDEMMKIDCLFSSQLFIYENIIQGIKKQLNIENIVDIFLFSDWKQRHTCLSCSEMRRKLGINGKCTAVDKQIDALEYFLNLIRLIQRKIGFGTEIKYKKDFPMLIQNIMFLLDHLNYEEHYFEDEEKLILIPKNPAATAVAELSSEDTAFAILMYHHASLKGKLEEKKDILRRIAKEYETLLDKGVDCFSDYFDKARAFLNNLDIRHNNISGKNKNHLLETMSAEELENWYDELYQLLLFCVLIKDNTARKNNMADFLKGLKKG